MQWAGSLPTAFRNADGHAVGDHCQRAYDHGLTGFEVRSQVYRAFHVLEGLGRLDDENGVLLHDPHGPHCSPVAEGNPREDYVALLESAANVHVGPRTQEQRRSSGFVTHEGIGYPDDHVHRAGLGIESALGPIDVRLP